VLVEPREIKGAEKKMLGFETLTFAPIDRRLIERDLLTADELRWLDDYHLRVVEIVGPQLEGEALEWLREQCYPI
jgi:Xaa-Pro aminopeptidase